MTSSALFVVLGSLCILCASAAQAAPHRPADDSRALDSQIEHVLDVLSYGDLDEAALHAEQLTQRFPRFKLGQWLHAEFSSVAAMELPQAGSEADWSEYQVDLMLEARTRLKTYRHRINQTEKRRDNLTPRSLAHLGKDIRDAIVVDLARSELMHFKVNGGVPTLVQRHYISSGSAGFGKRLEGDLRTPLGVYRIRGYRSDSTLPELYGDGALTLDYPNALDRALGRTGSGIWLHGVPRSTHSRAPWSSEGCVTMSNDHLTDLMARVDRANTLVVLTDEVEWLDTSERNELRQRWRELALNQRQSNATEGFHRTIGGSDEPVSTDTRISDGTLVEVPDSGQRQWVAWWPAGVPAGPTAWRFLPLPSAFQGLPTL